VFLGQWRGIHSAASRWIAKYTSIRGIAISAVVPLLALEQGGQMQISLILRIDRFSVLVGSPYQNFVQSTVLMLALRLP